MFQAKGLLTIPRAGVTEDRLLEIVLEAGADDVDSSSEDVYEVYTNPSDLDPVHRAIEAAGITPASVELARVPSTSVAVEDEKSGEQLLRLMEFIEDLDDVQKVFANFDISDELMEKLRG